MARRLVAAGLARDPETAYQHALEARRLAARVGLVRETAGIAAYQAGHWADALTELRAARRLTGRTSYLPMMADSERALGRADRALALTSETAAANLDRETQIELRIVESGIRRDQGLADAAVVTLQVPELTDRRIRPWSARLFYAYADALLDAGRTEQARAWFARSAAADRDGQTDAEERFDALGEVMIDDLEEDLETSSAMTRGRSMTSSGRTGGPERAEDARTRGPGTTSGHPRRLAGWHHAAGPGNATGPISRAGGTCCERAVQELGFSWSSQCMMPATLEAVPLTASNLAATAGSASGPKTA